MTSAQKPISFGLAGPVNLQPAEVLLFCRLKDVTLTHVPNHRPAKPALGSRGLGKNPIGRRLEVNLVRSKAADPFGDDPRNLVILKNIDVGSPRSVELPDIRGKGLPRLLFTL